MSVLKGRSANEANAMNEMDGKDEKGDLRVTGTIEKALVALKCLIPPVAKDDTTWEFKSVHLGKGVAEGKTLDDLHKSVQRNECLRTTHARKICICINLCRKAHVSHMQFRCKKFISYRQQPIFLFYLTVFSNRPCSIPRCCCPRSFSFYCCPFGPFSSCSSVLPFPRALPGQHLIRTTFSRLQRQWPFCCVCLAFLQLRSP